MDSFCFTVRLLEAKDHEWVAEMVQEWGADDLVSRGRVIHAADLPGFCAVGANGKRLGYALYEVTEGECQLVILHALERLLGVGTSLLWAVRDAAAAADCRRLWVITTNDNLCALRFYQRRGLELVAVHRGLLEVAERLKASIPLVGEFEIPIRDGIELEMRLD
jgi:N-acetylglutamate synthase-like GNAT family acetyltransferase